MAPRRGSLNGIGRKLYPRRRTKVNDYKVLSKNYAESIIRSHSRSVGRALAHDLPVVCPGFIVRRLSFGPLLLANPRHLLLPATIDPLQAPLRRALARPDRLVID